MSPTRALLYLWPSLCLLCGHAFGIQHMLTSSGVEVGYEPTTGRLLITNTSDADHMASLTCVSLSEQDIQGHPLGAYFTPFERQYFTDEGASFSMTSSELSRDARADQFSYRAGLQPLGPTLEVQVYLLTSEGSVELCEGNRRLLTGQVWVLFTLSHWYWHDNPRTGHFIDVVMETTASLRADVTFLPCIRLDGTRQWQKMPAGFPTLDNVMAQPDVLVTSRLPRPENIMRWSVVVDLAGRGGGPPLAQGTAITLLLPVATAALYSIRRH